MDEWMCNLPETIAQALEKAGLNDAASVLLCTEVQLCRFANLQATEYHSLLCEAARSIVKDKFLPVEAALKNKSDCLTTGCKILDNLLLGGIKTCGITELAGESSCGKTQMCLQLTLAVQYPKQVGGLQAGAVFICTEDVFPHQRLQQLITTFPVHWNKGKSVCGKINFGDNIFIEHIPDVESLKQCIYTRLPRLLLEHNVRLIIIDSIAGVFRNYESGDAIQRAHDLRCVGGKLHALAEQHTAAVVCVNQVTASLTGGDHEPIPALGLAWANMVTTRLQMFRNRSTGLRSIRVIFSPYLPKSSCKFVVTSAGISGVNP